MLVCRRDLLMSVCSAKALNLAIETPLPWTFHDDGSLSDDDKATLSFHFPGSRLIDRRTADAFYDDTGDKYPRLRRLRHQHVMLLKLADMSVYASADRVLYLDSDILFFARPQFLISGLLERGGKNYFNRDLATAYIAPPNVLRELTGTAPPERLNAGLSVLNRQDLSLARIEELLGLLDVGLRSDWSYYSHLIEQTIVALLSASSPSGVDHLPADYDVSLHKSINGAVCKHYVGAIRDQYELEGLRHLIHEAAFIDKWRAFCGRP
jgi:hypothetical protein